MLAYENCYIGLTILQPSELSLFLENTLLQIKIKIKIIRTADAISVLSTMYQFSGTNASNPRSDANLSKNFLWLATSFQSLAFSTGFHTFLCAVVVVNIC